MKRKIKILYVAAEISPYASAGGLGEVGKSFPKVLSDSADIEVRRVMPYHKNMKGKVKYLKDFPVPMGLDFETCVLKIDLESKEIPTYFIGNDRYFYRDNIYGYEDDGCRFFFFCSAIIEMLKLIPYKPDIIHTNDWHTGFIPLLIKKKFPYIKTVYTIHNIAYHGYIPASYLEGLLAEMELYQLGWPEWLDFMKAGIIHSDQLTTVSHGYCEEIQQPSMSYGMSSLIEQRPEKIVGILNGIDMEVYNPSDDGVLKYPYTEQNLEEKKKNRTLLRLEYGLPDIEVPLVIMVTRLDYSKGIDLILKVLHLLKPETYQLLILGSGNPYYQGILSCAATQFPETLVVDYLYSPILARKFYAAGDICLMPSQYEPCGLGQLYAMRYGAVPVVNPVGGLKDTVVDDKEFPGRSSGFYMEEWSGEALAAALKRAIATYYKADWSGYVTNGMKFDSSWKSSVSEYIKLYKESLKMNVINPLG